MPKLSEGDHEDGRVTVRLHGYDVPVTVQAEDLNIVARRDAEPGMRKPRRQMGDIPD